MEMNALNSLAEVGVGLNLAFGLIQNVRRVLMGLLVAQVTKKVSSIKAILSEAVILNGHNPAKTAVKIDDIEQRFCNWSKNAEWFFVALAFLVAISLICFLFEAAISPDKEISSVWAIVTLVILLAPIMLSALWQGGLFGYTLFRLSQRENEYRNALDLLSGSITPTSPDDPPKI